MGSQIPNIISRQWREASGGNVNKTPRRELVRRGGVRNVIMGCQTAHWCRKPEQNQEDEERRGAAEVFPVIAADL